MSNTGNLMLSPKGTEALKELHRTKNTPRDKICIQSYSYNKSKMKT